MSTADLILVIPDIAFDGGVDAGTAELIGAAAELGTPAVVAADPAHADELGAMGASVVVTGGAEKHSLIDVSAAALETLFPAAVVCAHTVRGRETAARLAARAGRALLVDAVTIRRDAEGIVTDHQNYGGAFSATAAATHSAPVITLRPGSVDARAEATTPEVREVQVEASERREAAVESVEALSLIHI